MAQEHKNVLVLGNGFDLYHKYKTGYKDFIEYIVENNPRNLRNNCFIDYFIKYNKYDKWIDFEYEIENIVKCFIKIINHIENNPIKDQHFTIELSLKETSILSCFRSYILTIDKHCEIKDVYFNKDIGGLDKRKMIKDLRAELDMVILELETYLFKSVIPEKSTVISSQLKEINHFDKVISFNYTHTYRIYNISDDKVDFIHGSLRNINSLNKKCDNNMVLGIQDINENLDFVYFKKYFQQVQKHIPPMDYNMFQQNTVNGVPFLYHLYFFGHSLSKTDGDIIRNIINLAHKTTIYYYDQDDYEKKNINLIDVFGKENYINRIRNNHSCEFIQLL